MRSERRTDAFRTLEARDGDVREGAASPRERDALTGLHSWAWFERKLAEWFAEERQGHPQLTVILADIDGLGAINDGGGRAAGDQVISAVAGCLRRRLRARDLLARHPESGFAVMLTSTPPHAARLVAERLRASVAADTTPPVTISIGCATSERGGFASRQQAMDAAVRALAAAKRGGRDRVVSVTQHGEHDRSQGRSQGEQGDCEGRSIDGRSAGAVGDPLDRSPHAV